MSTEVADAMSAASDEVGAARRDGRPRFVSVPLVRPAPLRQAVYDAMVEMIILRQVLPGEHLVEKELAAQLGVSRQPVREALQRLQAEGWVDLRPSMGAYVHLPTEQEADQLLNVRTLLEAESGRLAAGATTEAHVERLWELWRAGVNALAHEDTDALVTANADLHSYIMSMSQNSVLAEINALVDRRVRWYYAPLALGRGEEAWNEHAEVIRAIAAGDQDKAVELMRHHTERTRTMVAGAFPDRPQSTPQHGEHAWGPWSLVMTG